MSEKQPLNIFDQYHQLENKLTFALGVALQRSPKLRKIFLQKFAPGLLTEPVHVELQVPGDKSADKDERKGIPDLVLSDHKNNALLIEAKIGAKLDSDQLNRHIRSVKKESLKVCGTLIISARDEDEAKLAQWGNAKILHSKWAITTWIEIYRMIRQRLPKDMWAAELVNYMEIIETQLVEKDMDSKVKIVDFDGIPTKKLTQQYDPVLAKRTLRALMDKLEKDKAFITALGFKKNQKPKRRKAIANEINVWDFFSPTEENFTANHHFTVGIHSDCLMALLTIPNGAFSKLRKLAKTKNNGFMETADSYLKAFKKSGLEKTGARPYVVILQRRYSGMRKVYSVDGQMEFDLRTLTGVSKKGKQPKINKQPEWLESCLKLIQEKDSNVQFQIGVRFDYDKCPSLKDNSCLPHIKNALKSTMVLANRI